VARLIQQTLPAIHRLARAGDSYAQDLLGVFLAEGWGVEKDEKKALEWHRLAAAQVYRAVASGSA